MTETVCGTPLYTAPEIGEGKYSSNADLWSVGVILYECLCGETPFQAKTLDELARKKKNSPITFPHYISIPKECKDLITRLLQVDPNQRISWHEFFTHNWFAPNFPAVPYPTSPTFPIEDPKLRPSLNPFKDSFDEEEIISPEVRAAVAVAKLGDSYAKQACHGNALTLYIKALETLKSLHLKYSSLGPSSNRELLSTIKDEFVRYIEKCRSLVTIDHIVPEGVAEHLIFESAKWYGRQGATKEMLKFYSESKEMYETGLHLMEQILSDTRSSNDKQTVSSFIEKFKERLATVKQYL